MCFRNLIIRAMQEQEKYAVCVRCMTYNQSKYIEDALDGFCMQETSFPYVCLIVDDASTDGEQEIIAQYLTRNFDVNDTLTSRKEETDDYLLSFVHHSKNMNCYFAVLFLKYNHWGKKSKLPYYKEWMDSSKYTAICEGDDYWIDSSKLQKQVSFLEDNPDYLMCYGRCFHYYQNTNKLSMRKFGGSSVTFEEFLKGNTVPTPTTLFRVDAVNNYTRLFGEEEKRWAMGDYPKWLYFAHEGKIYFSQDVYAVYRVLANSASHDADEAKSERFVYNTFGISKYFADYYQMPHLYDENQLNKALFTHAVKFGNRDEALIRFKKIKRPSLKHRLKYFIMKYCFLYNICKGRLFYTHI